LTRNYREIFLSTSFNSPDTNRARLLLRGLAVSYLAVSVFFHVGFASHRGAVGVIGPYTPGYLAFLLVLAAALAFPLALGVLLYRVAGPVRTLRIGLRVAVGVALCYGVAEVLFASFRQHPFDPFLQFPGARFESDAGPVTTGTTRVVTLGGSTTHGGHLNQSARYPAVLENRLNEGEPSFEVFNAGMDWWTTKHSHINYVTYVRRWEPDVAVVMHTINDMYRSFADPRWSLGEYDSQWAHFFGPAIRGVKPKTLIGATLNQWNVWELNQRWYSRWRYLEVDLDSAVFRSLPDYEWSLRSLVRTLKADSVRVVLVTEPSIYRPDLNASESARVWMVSTFFATPRGFSTRTVPSLRTMEKAMETFNDVVRRVAQQENVEVVDAAASMPKTLEYFGDDVHFTERGAAFLASLVSEALRPTANPSRR